MQLENLKKKKNHRIIRTECGILDNANSYKVWEKYERDRINKGWNSRMIKSAEVNRIYTNGFFDGDLHMSWFRELMLMTTRLKIGTNSWLSSASTTTHNKCARHRPPVGPRSDWNHWCVSTLCGWWAFWIIFVIWGRGYFVWFLDAKVGSVMLLQISQLCSIVSCKGREWSTQFEKNIFYFIINAINYTHLSIFCNQ